MATKHYRWAWDQTCTYRDRHGKKCRINAYQKILLLYIAYNADSHGTYTIKFSRMSSDTGMTVQTAKKNLEILEHFRLVEFSRLPSGRTMATITAS